MRTAVRDTCKYDEMISILEGVLKHKEARGAEASDIGYYRLLMNYHRRVRHAHEEGKLVVGYTVMVPPEFLYAMDLVPIQTDNAVNTMVTCLKNQEEAFSIAKGFGLAPEICSAHRSQAAMYLRGWFPQIDAMLLSHQVCDSTDKSGEHLAHFYGVPGFYLDRPSGPAEVGVEYFAQELGEAIAFLEGLSGRKLDWDRLLETLKLSHEMARLQMEIYRLRELSPSPMSSRRAPESMAVGWLYSGTPEGVDYFRLLRDEVKARVEQGVGAVPHEKLRVMCAFSPPPISFKLLTWMEREHGAVVVADPFNCHWGEWEVDSHHPLETLAWKAFSMPGSRHLHGPAAEGAIPDVVSDAISHRVDGAIYWANSACSHGCALIRSIKDALLEKAAIPTVVVNSDMLDPSIAPEEEQKERLEGFFEMLAQKKGL